MRYIRVRLTDQQIESLVEYARVNGYERKNPAHKVYMSEFNDMARWAIMHKLGLEDAS